MILDQLAHADRYTALSPTIAAALRFLTQPDLATLPDGRVEIDGERVFAIVQRYRTKPPTEAVLEAHRRYIDVQYILSGVERMGYRPLDPSLTVTTSYDEANDVIFFEGAGQWIDVAAGSFAIFFPQDVHAPGLAAGDPPLPGAVLKIVVKCAVS